VARCGGERGRACVHACGQAKAGGCVPACASAPFWHKGRKAAHIPWHASPGTHSLAHTSSRTHPVPRMPWHTHPRARVPQQGVYLHNRPPPRPTALTCCLIASLGCACALCSFSGNEVSNLAWALAEIGHYEPQLWDAMAQYLLLPPPSSSGSSGSSGVRRSARPADALGGEASAPARQQQRSLPAAEGGRGRRALGARDGVAGAPARYAEEPLLARMQAFELSKLAWAYAKVSGCFGARDSEGVGRSRGWAGHTRTACRLGAVRCGCGSAVVDATGAFPGKGQGVRGAGACDLCDSVGSPGGATDRPGRRRKLDPHAISLACTSQRGLPAAH